MFIQVSFIDVLEYQVNSDDTYMRLREGDVSHAPHPKFSRWNVVGSERTDSSRR
jgi:hypothetical protein